MKMHSFCITLIHLFPPQSACSHLKTHTCLDVFIHTITAERGKGAKATLGWKQNWLLFLKAATIRFGFVHHCLSFWLLPCDAIRFTFLHLHFSSAIRWTPSPGFTTFERASAPSTRSTNSIIHHLPRMCLAVVCTSILSCPYLVGGDDQCNPHSGNGTSSRRQHLNSRIHTPPHTQAFKHTCVLISANQKAGIGMVTWHSEVWSTLTSSEAALQEIMLTTTFSLQILISRPPLISGL